MNYEFNSEKQARRRILLLDVRQTAELILDLDDVPEAKREFAQKRIATRLRYAAQGLESFGLKRFAARALDMAQRYGEAVTR
ncbi:MAG TPA: hypothetical protein VJ826_12500 [Candidatus Polarisedimenticolaceae bacterium]|nr:hypothetical protein [Candidatus Polarisedimenticolaceae bacterium]